MNSAVTLTVVNLYGEYIPLHNMLNIISADICYSIYLKKTIYRVYLYR